MKDLIVTAQDKYTWAVVMRNKYFEAIYKCLNELFHNSSFYNAIK